MFACKKFVRKRMRFDIIGSRIIGSRYVRPFWLEIGDLSLAFPKNYMKEGRSLKNAVMIMSNTISIYKIRSSLKTFDLTDLDDFVDTKHIFGTSKPVRWI